MKALFFFLVGVQLFAATPSMEEVSKVFSYKESGTDPVLYKMTLTSEVAERVPTDTLTTVSQGQKASVWLKFLVPNQAANPNVTVVIKKGQVPVKTREIVLKNDDKSGSYGYRTWTTMTYKKPGNYSIEIFYNDQVIKSMNFSVI